MSLLQEIRSHQPDRYCRFGKWLNTASKQDREDLAVAFADPIIRGIWISEALSTRIDGHLVDYVRKHRQGACPACPKTEAMLNVAQ